MSIWKYHPKYSQKMKISFTMSDIRTTNCVCLKYEHQWKQKIDIWYYWNCQYLINCRFFGDNGRRKSFWLIIPKFLILVLKKFGFGQNFISWIEIISKYQELCIINGEITAKYCKLSIGVCQGDSISAYLFILALEILPLLINPFMTGGRYHIEAMVSIWYQPSSWNGETKSPYE